MGIYIWGLCGTILELGGTVERIFLVFLNVVGFLRLVFFLGFGDLVMCNF